MKLSVSAFRAQATAQRKILKPYQNQLNYGACSSFSASGIKVDEGSHMMVDKTGISSPRTRKSGEPPQGSDNSGVSSQDEAEEERTSDDRPEPEEDKEDSAVPDKSLGGPRTKSNQRWMKLRTTVQLSGAISNTIQKSKPPLKREDSFLKRFSTRQIPEAQETMDTGDETEQTNGTRTQEEVNRRRRKRRKEQSRTVVNPDENFYFYWLMTVTVCVLYNLWTLIVRQSFPELQKDSSAFWYACDGFTDVVFVCDIAVQFRTGYLEQGLMVYDSRKLAKHYLKSRAFAFDLISLIPLDLLQMEIGTNPILRFPRFLKIYRVYSYYYIVESRTVYPNLWRVVNLIHILLILAHWFGCFYYLLSEAEGFQGAWVYPFRQGDDATLTRKYLGSLYWSTLTLTTIGDLPTPETNAEYVFTIVSYLIGVFIFATIVGQVGNVITNRNANRLEFERLLDGAKTYMRHHKVPGGMKRRVLRWYDYSWSRGRIQGGGDINTALGLLPDKLKTELALHVNLSVLKKVTIFQECQPEFLHDLVLKMKAYIFTPGDLICRKGEIAREMFIIADGILDVISDTGRVLTTMKAGDFFGEIGILNLDGLNKRTADVRSVGYSELFSLSREDVLTAMKDYPEAQEILQNLGRKRLMEARNASKIHKSQVKPIKEHESPGESENAGKRIVEKLRSDVKGLKNALRRSRRESRDEDDCESYGDGYGAKLQVKKPSILRRMSHVQSSDECETNETTPIGAGLPLLQRLKLLKEKQDREKEEKNKMSTSLPKRDNCGAADNVRLQAPKPVPDRESEISAEVFSEESVLSSREPDSRPKECSLPEDGIERDTANSDILPSGGSRGLLSFDDVGTGTLGEQSATNADSDGKENHSKRPQDFEMPKMSSAFDRDFGNQETSIQSKHVPKAKGNLVNSVPKQSLGSKLEVPKNKWNLFKKSSGQEKRPDGETAVKSREFYLSKSDTVLERQQSIEPTMGKRSRSMSPSDESKNRKRTLKSVVEYIIGQRRRSSSLGRSGRMRCDENPATDPPRPFGHSIKKYDSIDDLSPEYSGLPFVQKLKILNERQKLAELVENELVVRSASLEIPERAPEDESLPRSLSVASTIDLHGERGRTPSKTAAEMDCRIPLSRPRPFRPEDSFRAAMLDMKHRFLFTGSSGSLQSPESNETVERRHLKSILKKLSADECARDEDRFPKSRKRALSLRKSGPIDLKRLMRAPTVEGYVARHTKLTKSVTFDRETLPSPTETLALGPSLGDPGDGLAPASSISTLASQQSDLTAAPTASHDNSRTGSERFERETASETVTLPQKLEQDLTKLLATGAEWPVPFQDLPYEKLIRGLRKILETHLDAIQCRLRLQREDFEAELRKREEVISRLRTKLKEVECGNYDRRMAAISTSLESRKNCSVPVFDANCPEEATGSSSFRGSDAPFRISETDENDSADSREDSSGFGFVRQGYLSFKGSLSRANNGSYEKNAFESLEMAEIGDCHAASGTKAERPRRNHVLNGQNRTQEEKNRKTPKTKLKNRVADFRRSLSKSNDFVTVGIESSESSDPEEIRSDDWEIRMLADELDKMEEADEEEESELQQLEEMKKLEEDVSALKRVVCEGTLARFSTSELDMLETILEAKDQKISEMASNSCFDIAGHERTKPNVRRKGRSFLRRKIGQAVSFDFHDMNEGPRRKATTTRKGDSDTGPVGERHSLDDLRRESRFLRIRRFEDRGECASSVSSSDEVCRGESHPKESCGDIRSETESLPERQFSENGTSGEAVIGNEGRNCPRAEADAFRDQAAANRRLRDGDRDGGGRRRPDPEDGCCSVPPDP